MSIKAVLRILLSAVLVTLAAWLTWSARTDWARARAAAEARALDVAAVTRVEIEQLLDDAEAFLRVLAEDGVGVLAGERACAPWLSDGAGLFPQYTNILLLDESGIAVCASLPDGLNVSYADRDWFQDVATSERLVSGVPVRGRQSNAWALPLALPVATETGSRAGAVAVGIELVRLQNIIEAPDLPEGSVVTVARDSTLILARSRDPETWIGQLIPVEKTEADDLGAGRGRTEATTSEGIPSFFVWEDIARVSWRVYVGIPEEAIAGPVRRMLLKDVGVGTLAFVLLSLVALLSYHWIATSVDDLVAWTQRAASVGPSSFHKRGPAELQKISAEFQRTLTALRAAEEGAAKLARAVDQIADPVVITDAEGVIEYVNPAFVALSGSSSEELLGETARLMKSGSHDEVFHKEMWNTILSGRTFRGRDTNTRKDGSEYVEDYTITPMKDDEGFITHFVVTGKDVTAREALEARLRRAEKLEAVGQLAGGVAHDFNNILTTIQGHAELVGMMWDEGDIEGARGSLAEIMSGTEMAASLTAQLLAFSHRDSVRPEVLSLNDGVRKVESFLRRVFPADRKLILQLREDAGSIRIDPAHLELIVLNLALNARDALSVGGCLTLSTALVPADSHDPERAALTVVDTGAGMDAATAERAFEPFFTTKEGGTGLGLATVRDVVERAGGSVDITTELGRGTMLTVLFPRVEDRHETVKPVDGGVASAPVVGQVLLVEDTEAVGQLLVEMLKRRGYGVRWCTDGNEAQAEAEDLFRAGTPYDFVISDIVLPGQRGPDLVRRLLDMQPGLKVVLMSGYAGESLPDLDKVRDEVAFLQKPFTPAELWSVLDRLGEGEEQETGGVRG